MALNDLHEGFRIIDANRDRANFVGPRDPVLVAAAEAAVGATFPPTYREFVLRFGAGSFRAFEVYGVTTSNFENAKVPNGIWLTLDERRTAKLSNNFLVIGDTGDGPYYCIELRSGQEGPVVIYEPGIPADKQRPEKIAEDFGEFFLKEVREQMQR